ncbi:MAG: RiPP maturation radical SAM C-methyltransferase [Deltaproteobacteria bacterium]|nr:RiPP maturation radical SAM C-methyltransferase [Deltaproteobacteria bacterium]
MNEADPGLARKERIALVSTPWPLFDRPSIQLGALKAFLNERLPHIRVDACHVYLKIARDLGYSIYQAVSERSWIAESPYAALLYPDRMETIGRFWNRKIRGDPRLAAKDFKDLCGRIEAASLAMIDAHRWDSYLFAGFSICLAQLTSSLYFIREIKRRAPRLPIVVGGSACAGAQGETLIRAVPDIDYAIQGEGELPLLHLTAWMARRGDASQIPHIPGLIHRDVLPAWDGPQQVPDLDELPIPDYTDYFRDLESSDPGEAFLPRLPMEMSRGCWWNKGGDSKGGGGCAFCNLNLQWHGYREKSDGRTALEIDTLVNRHQVLSIYFMDNLLPARRLERRFQAIQRLGMDLQLFSEIRARTPRAVLEAMAAAGMQEVQVGIEALSSRLLKKFHKGTTAMDNLEMMKNCEVPHLPDLTGNLILGFPSSDSRDVSETLHHLSFAFPFRPLKGIDLWLGYGSLLWRHPDRYGIRLRGNHPDYRYLFPAEVRGKLRFMMQGYHGGVRHQHRMWAPVREKLAEWHAFYNRMHREPGCEPILSFRDGKDFLIIRERRLDDAPMTHRLKGTSRAIYLFCGTQRSMADIVGRFPRFGEDRIRPFLQMMIDKRLMFCEGERYLALAVCGGRRKA